MAGMFKRDTSVCSAAGSNWCLSKAASRYAAQPYGTRCPCIGRLFKCMHAGDQHVVCRWWRFHRMCAVSGLRDSGALLQRRGDLALSWIGRMTLGVVVAVYRRVTCSGLNCSLHDICLCSSFSEARPQSSLLAAPASVTTGSVTVFSTFKQPWS
jgi:hypothetical protein